MGWGVLPRETCTGLVMDAKRTLEIHVSELVILHLHGGLFGVWKFGTAQHSTATPNWGLEFYIIQMDDM